MSAAEQIRELRARTQQSIIGQEAVVERLVIGLLANGNLAPRACSDLLCRHGLLSPPTELTVLPTCFFESEDVSKIRLLR